MSYYYRPTLADIETSYPSGAYVITCDKSCNNPRGDHRFIGYTKKQALAVWRHDHPRKAAR